MQVQRDLVIQSQAFVVNRAVVNQATAEGNDPAELAPEKKPRSLRHSFSKSAKKILCQCLKLEARAFMHLKIERINFIDLRCDIADDFHIDLRRAFRFSEFAAQTFASRVAERFQVFVEIAIIEGQTRHRHTRHARIAICRKNSEGSTIFRRKLLQNDKGSLVLSRLSFQYGEQCLRCPTLIFRATCTEMAFPGRASDH